MNPDCPECTKDDFCPKHRLEYKKWVAETAQNAYMDELRNQSRKVKNEQARND